MGRIRGRRLFIGLGLVTLALLRFVQILKQLSVASQSLPLNDKISSVLLDAPYRDNPWSSADLVVGDSNVTLLVPPNITKDAKPKSSPSSLHEEQINISSVEIGANKSLTERPADIHNILAPQNSTTTSSSSMPAADKNSTSRRNNNNSMSKPFFLFHVGIPKSGTTTLQCGLVDLAKQLAVKSKLFYLGKPCEPGQAGVDRLHRQNNETAIRGHYLQYELDSDSGTGYVSKSLKERLIFHGSREGHTTLLSVEAIAAFMVDARPQVWERLTKLLDQVHTRIIIGYRHYFEWLPSFYFQKYYRQANQHWSKRRPSLLQYILTNMKEYERLSKKFNTSFAAGKAHPTLAAARAFSYHSFDDIQILDFHQQSATGGDLTLHFVCHLLQPIADDVCHDLLVQQARNDTTNNAVKTKRQSYSLHAERITEDAYAKGFFKGITVKKQKMINDISNALKRPSFSNFTNHPFYLSCLSPKDQERLYNMSLSLYKEMIGDTSLKGNTNVPAGAKYEDGLSFDELFETAAQNHKFCELDTNLVLADDTFRSFLMKLNKK